MTEFKRTLDQYLEGELEDESLDAALRETLIAAPDAAGDLEETVRDLRDDERMTERLYSSLMTRVRERASEVDSGSADATMARTAGAGEAATAVRREPAAGSGDGMIGAVFRERFILESEIGRGGMGIVYRARDLRREEAGDLQNCIAIKVLAGSVRDNPDAFVALQREAKRAQQLAHPNIATVYDFDREGDIAYLCMELLQGKPLDEFLSTTASRGLPFAEALPIIRGMANGLAYAHERGIVHADFKPNNVLLTDKGVVKILDFGIARVVNRPDRTTKTVFDAGRLQAMTPSYASCEMFNLQEPDPRDDIYALSCVAYELLTGAHPFSNLAAPQARAANLKPQPVSGLGKRQNRALRHGLAFAREDRTPSVEAFMEELTLPRGGTVLGGLSAAAGLTGLVGGIGIAAWLLSEEPPPPAPAATGTAATIDPGPAIGDPDPVPDQSTSPAPAEAPAAAGTAATIDPGPASGGPDSAPEPSTDPAPAATGTVAAIDPGPEPGADPAPAAEPEPAAPPVPVDEETRAKIGRILEIAGLHLASGRLLEPPGSNAAEAYTAVAELEPGNRASRQGLETVAARVEERARELAAAERTDEALAMVNDGLKWLPDHPGLTRLRGELQM